MDERFLDQIAELAKRIKRAPPMLVRIEQRSPDFMMGGIKHAQGKAPLTDVAALAAIPVYDNSALPLGVVRMIYSDGSQRDVRVPLFTDPWATVRAASAAQEPKP